MSTPGFAGSIPELYDRYMGPVLFEPYAHEVASRLPRDAARVLEVAAGTGRVTRQLLGRLPGHGELVVTDLNEPMLAEARRRVGDDPRITWQTADAQALPFEAAAFDAVVCAFGLMFPPDRAQAVREMRRVLRSGGTLVLTTWDTLANNPASLLLHELALALMPDNPPAFMAMPFSLNDPAILRAISSSAGFTEAEVETVVRTGEAASAADLAAGFVRGNPLWNQLVERRVDAPAFERQVAEALRNKFGDHPCSSALSAHVLVARA